MKETWLQKHVPPQNARELRVEAEFIAPPWWPVSIPCAGDWCVVNRCFQTTGRAYFKRLSSCG